jgi:hypothetical protein
VLVAGAGPDTIVLLAQGVLSAAPKPEIYFETNVAQAVSVAAGTDISSASSIAIHPGGWRVCLMLHDPGDDHAYLVEREIDVLPRSAVGTRRTTDNAEVLRGSVQYTPDGRRIGYIARTREGETVLRLLNSGESQRDGQDIISPVAGTAYAFSPESNQVLVALDTGEPIPRVALVDISQRTVVRNLGPGFVSRQAWLPGAGSFVYAGYRSVADFERNVEPQLILVDVQTPDSAPRAITQVPGGVGPSYAVSPNGEDIAAEVRAGRSAGVYLVEMSAVSR